MQIGPYRIETPLALAPMVGVTDRFFRGLCRDLGAGYTVSEMLASDPALRDSRVAKLRGDFRGEASPVAVQIAGSDPEQMAAAARYNAERGAGIIDINMGCPAKKVCNKLAGSALLSRPERVRAILEAVVGAVDVPVTLKIRTGPCPRERNGVEIALIAQDAGVSALAVHGRSRADRFKGQAEYDTIRDICRAVDLPVFANGDIDSPEKAAAVRDYTGAAGLMIGRAAQGNPWIFREIRHYFETGLHAPPAGASEVLEVMERHLRVLHRSYGEQTGVRVARRHIGWYLDGRPDAGEVRRRLMRSDSAREQFALLRAYFRGQPDHGGGSGEAGRMAA